VAVNRLFNEHRQTAGGGVHDPGGVMVPMSEVDRHRGLEACPQPPMRLVDALALVPGERAGDA
jgi:hypothetical protein